MCFKSKCSLKFFLSTTILIISLSQLYFQYSAIMTPRNKDFHQKDKRNNIINIVIFSKNYDFNFKKLEEDFDDNALMRINLVKNYTLKGLEKIKEKSGNKYDIKILMLFYLLIYDFIYLIFLYIFYFNGFKAGIVKIIIQIFKFYFTGKRIKLSNHDICIGEAISNFFNNSSIRGWGFFTPEGFQIFEFLCNFVIILDIIWLIIIKKNINKYKKKNKGDYITLEEKIVDEQTVIKKMEDKNYSNESKDEENEDEDDNNNDDEDNKEEENNNNINNTNNDEQDNEGNNDEEENINENMNENENDNINNNEDDIPQSNNNIFEDNSKDKEEEVQNSLNQMNDGEDQKENYEDENNNDENNNNENNNNNSDIQETY